MAHALSVGYRHLDTAQAYENEDRVDTVIAASEVPREEIFVAPKLPRSSRATAWAPRPRRTYGASALAQVDLLLIP